MLNNKFKFFLILVCSVFSLTSCIPNGNVVGNARFVTIDSNFADAGDISIFEVNAGIVSTPNGTRIRLNKANFSVPSKGIYLTSAKFNDFIQESIPKSAIADSRLKGKNTCGYVNGVFNDGQIFSAILFSDVAKNTFIFLQADAGGIYYGQAVTGKIQIGGRNLCG